MTEARRPPTPGERKKLLQGFQRRDEDQSRMRRKARMPTPEELEAARLHAERFQAEMQRIEARAGLRKSSQIRKGQMSARMTALGELDIPEAPAIPQRPRPLRRAFHTLQSPDASERVDAARMLQNADPIYAPAAAFHLGAQLRVERDPSARAALLDALVYVHEQGMVRGDDRIRKHAAPFLQAVWMEDTNPGHRARAVRALALVQGRDVTAHLQKALQDDAAREHLLATLVRQPGTIWKEHLLRIGSSSAEEGVHAVSAFRHLGREGIPWLAALLRSSNPQTRTAALDALADQHQAIAKSPSTSHQNLAETVLAHINPRTHPGEFMALWKYAKGEEANYRGKQEAFFQRIRDKAARLI